MGSLLKSSRTGLLAAACLFPAAILGQEPPGQKLTVRTLLNDPANPDAKLFAPESPGHLAPLALTAGELPRGQEVAVIEGKLNLYSAPQIDAASPSAALVASATVPKNLKQAIAIVQPRGDGKLPPCSIVFVDDSLAAFPPGESRVLSLTALPITVQAGEHKIPVAPGKITPVPPITKVDAYNIAQASFYYKSGESWIAFSETKMKFLKDYRQVFVCLVRPGTKTPSLITLIDDTPKS